MSNRRPLRRSRARAVAATATAGAFILTMAPAARATGNNPGPYSDGPVAVALTATNRLVTFGTYSTWSATSDVAVTGLAANEVLVGIDRRPKDLTIYAIARAPQSTSLYRVDAASGQVTKVADLVTTTGAPVVLFGAEFGVDFNPAADAIRIVSDGGQNLRVLPTERTVENVVRPAGTTFADGTLNEGGFAATGVTAAAYAGNDDDPATPTKLYVLDADDDRVLVQDPPNAGTLGTPVKVKGNVGRIGAFDILTLGGKDYAYATLHRDSSGKTRLVKVDLGSGQVRDLGRIPTSAPVRGVAL